jgi:hypothetical protein
VVDRQGYRPEPVATSAGTGHTGDDMTGATADEQRDFARGLHSLLAWLQADRFEVQETNEVVALITGHLGDDASEHSVVARMLPPFEHVNLQTALDAWTGEPGRSAVLHGITVPPHHEPASSNSS